MEADVRVELGDRSYPIRLRAGGLAQVGEFAASLHRPCPAALLTDNNVAPLYAAPVRESLARAGFRVHDVVIAAGEEQKNLATFGLVCERMVEAGLDRRCLLVTLGGGVVGDLGGFVAASYMRGVPYLQVPTTLLAQVDSSVGGKTAVNLPQGKNLVGAFHQPAGVFIDTEALRTLSPRDVRAGMVEVVKYGVIRDADFFRWLEENLDSVLALAPTAVLHAVRRSCEVKAEVVAADEREGGLRAILNYGHTVGHAVEALAAYGTLRHGEAVAMGMEVASALSRSELGFGAEDARRQSELLRRLSVPARIKGLRADAIASMLLHDKKTVGGLPRFVLAECIGRVRPGCAASADALRSALLACGAAP